MSEFTRTRSTRRGMHLRPLGSTPPTQIVLRADPDMIARVRAMAQARRITVAECVRQLVEKALLDAS